MAAFAATVALNSKTGRRVVLALTAALVVAVVLSAGVAVAGVVVIAGAVSQAQSSGGGGAGTGFSTPAAVAALCHPGTASPAPSAPGSKPVSWVPAGDVAQVCAAYAGTDARALAGALVLLGGVSEVDGPGWDQIRGVAAGTPGGCVIDARILRLILAVRMFNPSVVVSDINRKCAGTCPGLGAGFSSAHCLGAGGAAVDFAALNGHALTGRDAQSVSIIQVAQGVLHPGSRIGQAQCGPSVSTPGFEQFQDTCDHLHVDVYWANG